MQFLESQDGADYVKKAFDGTSNYARLTRMRCHVSGRMLFIRFVASTGDAMGMNMLSKVGSTSEIKEALVLLADLDLCCEVWQNILLALGLRTTDAKMLDFISSMAWKMRRTYKGSFLWGFSSTRGPSNDPVYGFIFTVFTVDPPPCPLSNTVFQFAELVIQN